MCCRFPCQSILTHFFSTYIWKIYFNMFWNCLGAIQVHYFFSCLFLHRFLPSSLQLCKGLLSLILSFSGLDNLCSFVLASYITFTGARSCLTLSLWSMSNISLILLFSGMHLSEVQGVMVRLVQSGLLSPKTWGMSNIMVNQIPSLQKIASLLNSSFP